jgi:hypothetical protein
MKSGLVAIAMGLMLPGCGDTKPYTIFKRESNQVRITVSAEAPPDAGLLQMQSWAREIVPNESDGTRPVVTNFHKRGRESRHIVAQCYNGACRPMR